MTDWSKSIQEFTKSQFNGKLFINNPDFKPKPKKIFRCFEGLNPEDVRVVFFGTDPFPKAASGLAFHDETKTEFGDKYINGTTSGLAKLILLFHGKLKKENVVDMSNFNERQSIKDELDAFHNVDDFFEETKKMGVLWLNVALTYDPQSTMLKDKQIIKTQHQQFWRPVIKKVIEDILSVRDCIFVCSGAKTTSFSQDIQFLTMKYNRQCKIIICPHLQTQGKVKEIIQQNIFQQIRNAEVDLEYDESINFLTLKLEEI